MPKTTPFSTENQPNQEITQQNILELDNGANDDNKEILLQEIVNTKQNQNPIDALNFLPNHFFDENTDENIKLGIESSIAKHNDQFTDNAIEMDSVNAIEAKPPLGEIEYAGALSIEPSKDLVLYEKTPTETNDMVIDNVNNNEFTSNDYNKLTAQVSKIRKYKTSNTISKRFSSRKNVDELYWH